MPESLEALAREGFIARGDLRDPWGRAYAFRVDATGFELSGRGTGSEPRDDLLVRRPFSASQRMVLQGGATEQDRPPVP
jgi:hypothetical protein